MPQNTERPSKRLSKKTRLQELARAAGWSRVGEPEWNVLTQQIPGLRTEDLQASQFPADPPWSGITQHTLDELQASLTAFADVYQSRPDLRHFCRSEVIRAKDRARAVSLAPAASPDRRALKQEMVEWMLIWLGDPSLFAAWVTLRRARSGLVGTSAE